MIKSKKDLYAGLMFMVLGTFFALWALNYPMGSSVRMGPAYFPTILGWMTAGLGAIIFIRGLTIPDVDPNPIKWRPLLLINGAAVVFGLLVDPLKIGLVGAVVASVIVCAYGGYEFKWKEAIAEAVILIVVVWGAFVWGLGPAPKAMLRASPRRDSSDPRPIASHNSAMAAGITAPEMPPWRTTMANFS